MMSSDLDADDGLATRKSTAVLRFPETGGAKALDELASQLTRHERGGVRTVLIDLDAVNYVNSTALAVLVRLRKESLDRGLDVQLVNVTPHVMDILRTTRLVSFFFPA
jgi:anti-anti-sigma factor